MAANPVFRSLRIFLLLLLLAGVTWSTWAMKLRTTSWDSPLWVAIYPVNATASDTVARYIDALDSDHFEPVAGFLAEEAEAYGVGPSIPARVVLAPQVTEIPPLPPEDGNPLAVVWWSLGLRWFARSADTVDRLTPDVRIFVIYHDPLERSRLPHSAGLQKGLIGVVHAFADRSMAGANSVVIAHELLHTVGATDKYDPRTNAPLHPHGYAEPGRSPLHPQTFAELMGGRIPRDADDSETPRSLSQVVIGEQTAREINWIR